MGDTACVSVRTTLVRVLARLGVLTVALGVVVVGETERALCLRTLCVLEVVVVVVVVSCVTLKRGVVLAAVCVVSVCAEARPNASIAPSDKTIFFMVLLFLIYLKITIQCAGNILFIS